METTAKKLGIVYEDPVITWESEKRFFIPGVSYRGQTRAYRLFEEMTSPMTQDKLAEFYEKEKQKGNPVPTDAPLIWAIAASAYNAKDSNPQDAKKLRQFLAQSFSRCPNTLTRIAYNPKGNDKIMHNYGTSDEYSIDELVVGPDRFIQKIPDQKVLESLLGTQDVAKINEVSQFVNGTNAYIWRLNSKPTKKEERVARFGADGGRLLLICFGDPLVGYPAFRVLQVE